MKDLPVNFATPAKNKQLLVASFPAYKEEIERLRGKNINRVIETIKEVTILRLKIEIAKECDISDFFENSEKIFSILNKFVDYHFDIRYDTKYRNFSEIVFKENLFGGFSSIKRNFLKENEENIFLTLREKELI